MGAAGAGLKRCFALDAVAGEQLIDPRSSHPIGGRHLADRAALNNDSGDD
jgi:hypothetical protein